jgi:hypothetical protein
MYALVGSKTNDLLTYRGRPIVHDSRSEMEYLLPNSRVVRVSDRDLTSRSPLPPIQLREHPDLQHLTWPLKRSDFRE